MPTVFACPKCHAAITWQEWSQKHGCCKDCVPRKHRNIPTQVGALKFDSKKEATRYLELLLLERGGQIDQIDVHPRYYFYVNGCYVGRYTADFRYREMTTGKTVVEDVKGGSTRKLEGYVIRKNLMKALYNIDIVEV